MPADPATPPVSRRERRRRERAEIPSGQRRRATQKSPARKGPSLAVVSLLAVLFGFGGIAALQLAAPGDGGSSPPVGNFLIPPATIPAGIAVDGESAGRPDAALVLEIYGDYQCPVCARFAREYLGRLVADFVQPGDLRVVDRAIAFLGTGRPDESEQAAIGAACAAEQNRYWPFHDILLWNQHGENEGAFSRERLAAMADAVGLERGAWDACVADPARLAAIRLATADAAAAQIVSTPTLVLGNANDPAGGERIVGMPRTYEELAAAIRARLATGAVTSIAPTVP
ncbi:MAG: thioredoxin domain-containing protein [Chloroflexota bacterium]